MKNNYQPASRNIHLAVYDKQIKKHEGLEDWECEEAMQDCCITDLDKMIICDKCTLAVEKVEGKVRACLKKTNPIKQ